MFKFNPVKHKINESLFNHHDKFKDLSENTNEISKPSASGQFNTIITLYEQRNQNIHFLDNAALKKKSFYSNYKNNLSQFLDFEVIKIIESSLSIYYNQFYKGPSPENIIIGLHYRGYSASDMEFLFYLYVQNRKENQVNLKRKQRRENKIVLIDSIQDNELNYSKHEKKSINQTNPGDQNMPDKIVYTPSMNSVFDESESNQIDQDDEIINKIKCLKDEIKGFNSDVQKLGQGVESLENYHLKIKEIKTLINRCKNIGTIRCLNGVNA
ncbi:26049_t:CDS:1 [Gigaspora margarita]|uniref:26049_t:CDS:1 n=1 Tax=Gigaspora margarita TaxID=4874 RepID=A0ABN7UJT2_GIGMA|nr:26049_t:CDS:1 [Gigaspora margarita]